MIQNFLETLNGIFPISDETKQILQSKLTCNLLPKGSLLLSEGQISDKLFFICNGMARAFYYENSNEITSWIVSSGNFIYSPSSFINQKPSFETIQLVEQSTVITFDYSVVQEMYLNQPEILHLALKISQKYLLVFDERVRSLRLSASDRYFRYAKQFPEIVANIKVDYLASYLGLSRATLNALRAKKS